MYQITVRCRTVNLIFPFTHPIGIIIEAPIFMHYGIWAPLNVFICPEMKMMQLQI